MNKVKVLSLLLLGVLLALFARENWYLPEPPVKLFGYGLLPLPQSLIIFGCLLLGFSTGWVAHALRLRRKRRAAAQAPSSEQPQPQQTD